VLCRCAGRAQKRDLKNVYKEENKKDIEGLPAETLDTYFDKRDSADPPGRPGYNNHKSIPDAL